MIQSWRHEGSGSMRLPATGTVPVSVLSRTASRQTVSPQVQTPHSSPHMVTRTISIPAQTPRSSPSPTPRLSPTPRPSPAYQPGPTPRSSLSPTPQSGPTPRSSRTPRSSPFQTRPPAQILNPIADGEPDSQPLSARVQRAMEASVSSKGNSQQPSIAELQKLLNKINESMPCLGTPKAPKPKTESNQSLIEERISNLERALKKKDDERSKERISDLERVLKEKDDRRFQEIQDILDRADTRLKKKLEQEQMWVENNHDLMERRLTNLDTAIVEQQLALRAFRTDHDKEITEVLRSVQDLLKLDGDARLEDMKEELASCRKQTDLGLTAAVQEFDAKLQRAVSELKSSFNTGIADTHGMISGLERAHASTVEELKSRMDADLNMERNPATLNRQHPVEAEKVVQELRAEKEHVLKEVGIKMAEALKGLNNNKVTGDLVDKFQSHVVADTQSFHELRMDIDSRHKDVIYQLAKHDVCLAKLEERITCLEQVVKDPEALGLLPLEQRIASLEQTVKDPDALGLSTLEQRITALQKIVKDPDEFTAELQKNLDQIVNELRGAKAAIHVYFAEHGRNVATLKTELHGIHSEVDEHRRYAEELKSELRVCDAAIRSELGEHGRTAEKLMAEVRLSGDAICSEFAEHGKKAEQFNTAVKERHARLIQTVEQSQSRMAVESKDVLKILKDCQI